MILSSPDSCCVVRCWLLRACLPQERHKILSRLPVKHADEKKRLLEKYAGSFWRWFSELRCVCC